MNPKEPLKITLSGIIRWIFGLFFIVSAAGMVTKREYFSAVFIFMAAFVSFPPISNLLESDLNISLSGPVRFLVVIFLLVGSVAVEPNHLRQLFTPMLFQDLIVPIRITMLVIGSGNGIRHLI